MADEPTCMSDLGSDLGHEVPRYLLTFQEATSFCLMWLLAIMLTQESHDHETLYKTVFAGLLTKTSMEAMQCSGV